MGREDDILLLSEEGIREADGRLAGHFRSVGAEQNYRGEFYPDLHKFDLEMQTSAFRWLHERLA